MPADNAFRHQDYLSGKPGAEFELLQPSTPDAHESSTYRDRMAHLGERLAAENVSAVYLIHGTLVGTDATGMIGVLGRFMPEWADMLGQHRKQIADLIMGEWANYSEEYAQTLRQTINQGLGEPIDVQRFLWESENNHTGRANAAVRLIDELYSRVRDQSIKSGQRVQLWGHSHGGNVLAIVSNLLGGSLRSRSAFFRAAKPVYRRADRTIDVPVWARVRELLLKQHRNDNPLADIHLDMVTFGTPVRYGWDSGGYSRLTHFIYHRPTDGLAEYLAPFPPTLEQMYDATAGDFVQQFFIAGTNFPVNLLAFRRWRAERKLKKILQGRHSSRKLLTWLNTGARVPDEGRAMLVDYSTGDPEYASSVAGHAIYTHRNWLPFHLETLLGGIDG